MAKKSGKKIDELYLSLGLDISELENDFALADKTVNEAMAELNRKKTQIKLQADIDTNKLTGATAATDALTIKEKALTKELEIQKQRVSLVNAEYKNAIGAKGENSALAQKLQTNLLREQQAYTKLEAEIRKTNAQIKKTGTQIQAIPKTSGIKNIMNEVNSLTSGLGVLNAKAMAFVGLMSTGAGFLNLTNGAMQSGEALYQLSKKLNMTTAEAAKMKIIFDMGGVDVQSIIERLATLDKGVISAGAAGNETTRAMQKFGISLQDASGNLLPMNQQLDQLALGYRNAAENGRVEAYIAEVLGSEGAKLIPILEQYEELSTAAARIQTTGLLNPKEAHDLFVEWRILTAEAGQLKGAVGAALMPVAKEIMPGLVEGTTKIVASIRENKEEIKQTIELAGRLAEIGGSAFSSIGTILDSVGVNAKHINENLASMKWLSEHHPQVTSVGFVPIIGPAMLNAVYGDEYKEYQAQQEQEKAKKKAEIEERKEQNEREKQENRAKAAEALKLKRIEQEAELEKQMALDEAYHKTHSRLENELYDLEKQTEKAKTSAGDQVKIEKDAQKQRLAIIKKYNDERIAAEKELKETIFSLTHNELENTIHEAEKKVEEYRKRGASETLITQRVELEKAKIMKDFQDNTLSKLESIYKTNLQNRLDEIQRETEAYKKKGVEEVKATLWAEHEKSAARKKEAISILSSQKKEFDIFKKAMQGQTGGFDGGAKTLSPDASIEERMQVAQREIMRKRFKDLGITSEDLAFLTPGHLDIFTKIQKAVNDLPFGEIPQGLGLPSYIPEANSPIRYRDTSGIGKEELDKLNYAAPAANNIQNMTKQEIQVNINIDSPVVQDDAMIMQISERAADKIKTVLKQELGGDENSY